MAGANTSNSTLPQVKSVATQATQDIDLSKSSVSNAPHADVINLYRQLPNTDLAMKVMTVLQALNEEPKLSEDRSSITIRSRKINEPVNFLYQALFGTTVEGGSQKVPIMTLKAKLDIPFENQGDNTRRSTLSKR
jgi:hypothetical protein